MESITYRHCSRCGEIRPINTRCKPCTTKYRKLYRATHHKEIRDHNKIYRALHREQKSEWAKKYYVVHSEQIKEQRKIYHAIHRERDNRYNREYSTTQREKINKHLRKYRATYPEKQTAHNRRRRAYKANAEGNGVSAEQWSNLLEEYNYLCAYCNGKKSLEMDHIVPLSSGGRHDLDNVVPACKSCNSSKGDTLLLMFLYRRQKCA